MMIVGVEAVNEALMNLMVKTMMKIIETKPMKKGKQEKIFH